MFWNDIKEIKEGINRLLTGLEGISETNEGIAQEESDSLDRLHDKLSYLIDENTREQKVELALKTLDKFDDYMKNVDKLNEMVNEFKGCVSIARAAIADKKELDEMKTVLKGMMESCQKYYLYQKTVGDQYFKIDAIYKALCEKEKKPRKKRGPNKKKVTSPSTESI